jgi:hypothetical protein
MIMNPALILFGIQSLIRLGKITKDASEQYVRDAEVLFPDIRKTDFNPKTYVNGFFGSADYEAFVRAENAPYKQYWGDHGVKDDLNSVDTLFAAAVKIKAEQGIDLNQWLSDSQAIAGAALVEQWDPKKAPLSPFARIILAAGDMALEYVSVNPGILGVGGNGEKLICAYAKNLSNLLPDDGKFGDNEKFGERLLGVFLRAGFDTINKNPEWIVSEEHVQKLISVAVDPIVKALPRSITEQIVYREVTDALIEPAASTAMQVLAEHSSEFLGPDFGAETAMGALTRALLSQAAKTGLNNTFTKEGLIDLYKAALGVAAKQPHLFLDANADPQDYLTLDLISNFASVLMNTPPPFNGSVGVQLAAAALEAVSANSHRFTHPAKSWNQSAADMVSKLAEILSVAFKLNQNIEKVFSKAQLIELGRIILNHAATTPEMVVGQNEALKSLAGVVAKAMARDENLLLDGEDWLEIVKVAAQEASANPGRLFKLNSDDPAQTIATQVISTILSAAGAILDWKNLTGNTVLFGKTLRQAIIIVLHATSGNPWSAKENLLGIELLIKSLNELVTKHAEKFGSKEWLYLFRMLLSSVLEGEKPGDLSVEKADKLLSGRF